MAPLSPTTTVTSAWEGLLEAGQARRLLLEDTVEKFRFFNMVRDLMLWMDGVNLQIDAHDSPRWMLYIPVTRMNRAIMSATCVFM